VEKHPSGDNQQVGGFYGSADGASDSRERSDDRLVVQKDTSVLPIIYMVAYVLDR